jgi:Ca-activated chloride channel family protein
MTRRPTRSVAARALLLVLLLTAVWNPALPWQAPPLDLVILVDASQSMDPAARDRAWQAVAERARRLPAGSRVAVVRFGARAVVELPLTDARGALARAVLAADTPPHSRYVDDTQTDISAAMNQALRVAAAGRGTRVALISDGRATTGATAQALTLARRAGIPVYLLPPAASSRGRDSWIAALAAPEHVGAGRTLPVTVTLASRADTRGDVVIAVDDKPYAERQVTLTPETPTTLHIDMAVPAARSAVISARLRADGDPEPRNNRAARIVNIDGASPVFYVSRRPAEPALARSLRAGGWDVRMTDPAAFARRMTQVRAGSIVLDDVAIADMPDATWDALARAVTVDGAGLLVLGGPHAYGAGGYRHSRLEDLLPVTAEARQPLPPAAVLFMLDTSGSMDRRDDGPSRLDFARRAVLETVRRLRPDDAVGLQEFAAAPHQVLSLTARPDTEAALRAATRRPPAGGTRLGPALDAALTTLGGVAEKQKLLILVTDGYVDKIDLDAVAKRIKRAGIDVVALAIGPDADTTALAPLTRINHGRLLRVNRIAQLPTLMGREVDQRRSVTQSGRFTPVVATPPPFLPAAVTPWPPLTRYAVTRERPAAAVYLRVHDDPLLAAGYAGAGRVVALTTDLDAWHGLWNGWPHGGDFAGGLLDWIDARHGAADLRVVTRDGGTRLTVETPDDATAAGARTDITIRAPSGEVADLPLTARAPGEYTARIDDPLPGRYSAVIRVGDRRITHDWLYGGDREFMPPAEDIRNIATWKRGGLLQPWPGARLADHAAGAAPGVLRTPLLAVSAMLYGLLLVWERRADLVRTWANKLRQAGRAVVPRRRAVNSTT